SLSKQKELTTESENSINDCQRTFEERLVTNDDINSVAAKVMRAELESNHVRDYLWGSVVSYYVRCTICSFCLFDECNFFV
ncbi:unnamed protein product, partial [Schistosoma mattheei]